ncbi:MAG: AMP-binding protein [Methylotetracoccus sp.]
MSSRTLRTEIHDPRARLVAPERLDATIAMREGRPISGRQLLDMAATIALQLPEADFAINLCNDRLAFLLGFIAAMLRGQTTLLPPNRTAGMLDRVIRAHRSCYAICDAPLPDALGIEEISLGDIPDPATFAGGENPAIPAEHLALIAFTSGSTGEPQAQPKRWDLLCHSADLIGRALGVDACPGYAAVATVPVQHMYGLETAILLPLRCGSVLTRTRPFFPADIHAALASLPRPRMLITTPVHLRACMDHGDWTTPVDLLVSATAPLSADLSRRVEAASGGRVLEIYGFTEAGSVATRRPAVDNLWTPFPGIRLLPMPEAGAMRLEADYLQGPHYPQDWIELAERGRFQLGGRLSDQINVAGKRTSLAALDSVLCSIAGVVDGAFFLPDGDTPEDRATRLSAFAVAPALDAATLIAELRLRIDAAFLPRPLYLVDSLPRQANGKLARRDLQSLAERCARTPSEPPPG